jgi:hypothetical protein
MHSNKYIKCNPHLGPGWFFLRSGVTKPLKLSNIVSLAQKLTHYVSFWAQRLNHYVSFFKMSQFLFKWIFFCVYRTHT